MFSQFEQVSCTLNDVECWSARDLCTLLGYKLWQIFTKVIDKAKEACANVSQQVEDHFIDVNKMVVIGSGAERQVDDVMLTRYDCYLVAQNGEPQISTVNILPRIRQFVICLYNEVSFQKTYQQQRISRKSDEDWQVKRRKF